MFPAVTLKLFALIVCRILDVLSDSLIPADTTLKLSAVIVADNFLLAGKVCMPAM